MPPRRKEAQQPSFMRLIQSSATDPNANAELLDLLNSAEEEVPSTYDFDTFAPGTVKRHTRHRTEYEDLMKLRAARDGKTYDDNYLWGAENVEKNIRLYLCFSAATMDPRESSHSAKYQTLVQRRQSMMYHATRKCPEHMHNKLSRASHEAVVFALRKHNKSTTKSTTALSHEVPSGDSR